METSLTASPDSTSPCNLISSGNETIYRGMCTWILHHPSKGDPPPGQAARGSGALSGYADILLEMRSCPDAEDDDRRRRLLAFSRFPKTPRQRVIELTADGAD